MSETNKESTSPIESVVMCGYCKDCYWRDEWRACTNDTKIFEDYNPEHDPADDRMVYPYMEGGRFEVGDYFGCVHFKS